jgi:ABC-type transport system substrate-binding protein
MAGNYWTRVLTRRLTRRRALTATGGVAAASAFLLACGGDDEPEPTGATGATGSTGTTPQLGVTPAAVQSPSAPSGLIAQPQNETSNAKRGGTLLARNTFEPNTLDPHVFPANFHVSATYSNLWRIKPGVMEYTDGTIEGDVVESWEVSPDRLKITAKINPKAHFAPVAPVDGRAVDAHDVAATWQRHSTLSNSRTDFSHAANPAAPIISINAIDDGTIEINLSEPNAVVMARLARATPGSHYIIPKEALDEGALDLARTSIGSGPFYISDYQPSLRINFKRNPGYGQTREGFPFIDELEYPIVQEYATFISQFRAGNIHLSGGMRAEDILPTKRDLNQLELMSTDFSTLVGRVGFGVAEGSPFVDERLRQAWVLTWDRELYLDTLFNASRFRQEGIDISLTYESGLQADTYRGWLLDPLSPEFGPNSQFFKQDLEEARRLVTAAGHPDGLRDFDLTYAAPGAATPAGYSSQVEPIIGLTQDSGLFHWNLNIVQNFFAEFFPRYHNQANAPFSGVAISLSNLNEDPANYLFSYYNSRGSLRMGTDSHLDDLTGKAVGEFDEDARQELCFEIQRYEGGKNFYPRFGGGTGLSLGWPAVRNREVYRGGSGLVGLNNPATLWLDPDKPPLGGS